MPDSRVKAHASSAGIGAALLLFFGFFHIQEPVITDLFSRAAWVFYHTLRWGGLAMGAVAVGLLMGHRLALVADSVVAGLVGVLLVGTGLVMLVDGGGLAQPLINVVCGSGFVSAGLHSWRTYQELARASVSQVEPIQSVHRDAAAVSQPKPATPPNAPTMPPTQRSPEGYLAALGRREPPSEA